MEANNELFNRIIDKAIDTLKKHGAEFIVKKHGGELVQYGSLKLHEELPPKPAKRTRKQVVAPGAYKAIYRDIAECIMPGDEYTFEVPEGDNLSVEGCRGAFCAWATEAWGKRSYTTVVDEANRTFSVQRRLVLGNAVVEVSTQTPEDEFRDTVQRMANGASYGNS